MALFRSVLTVLRTFLASRASLAAEIILLRHQLTILRRSVKRPKVQAEDRILLVCLSRLWSGWQAALLIIKPVTVVRWHRQGFRLYWKWKSHNTNPGRPKIDPQIRALIRRLAQENPIWGTPRIQSELALLGHAVAESTVDRYKPRAPKPPSQNWRTFLKNHATQIAAVDFFTLPTVSFRVLYVFVVLRLDRRRVVHFNITPIPPLRGPASRLPKPSRSTERRGSS